MIRAIFSDFNGVIVDDERLQMEAYQQVLRPHGIELTEEQYFSALGMDDKTFVRAAFKRTSKNLTEDLTAMLIEEKSNCHRNLIKDELPLFPGVVTFLKAASRHFSLGLVSMARRIEIEHILDRARLDKLFSVIISAEDVNACKPATDCYRFALQALNSKRRKLRLLPLLAEECLVIEDSPPGVESGRGAGMRTLGITNTVVEAELRNAGADVVSANLADWTIEAVHLVFDEG